MYGLGIALDDIVRYETSVEAREEKDENRNRDKKSGTLRLRMLPF